MPQNKMSRKKNIAHTLIGLLGLSALNFLTDPGKVAHAQAPGSSAQVQSVADVIKSPRWRKLQRYFDEWLSVQKMYSPAEVADMKGRLQSRVADMSVTELEDFMYDMEDRLEVLLSDEAADARYYLSFFNEQARRNRIAPQGEVPQVFEISATRLRQELRQFQQQRQQQVASHGAFRQSQGQRVTEIRREQRDRQVRQAQSANEARSQLAAARQQELNQQQRQPPVRSQYTPRPLVTSEDFARIEVLRGIL